MFAANWIFLGSSLLRLRLQWTFVIILLFQQRFNFTVFENHSKKSHWTTFTNGYFAIFSKIFQKSGNSILKCETFLRWFSNFVILQQLPKCTSGSAISPQDLVANSSTQSNLVVAYKSFQSNSIIRQNITKPILSTGYSKPFKKPKKEHSLKGYKIQKFRRKNQKLNIFQVVPSKYPTNRSWTCPTQSWCGW